MWNTKVKILQYRRITPEVLHSMATNWSIMAARAQMGQVKLEEFNLKGLKSTED